MPSSHLILCHPLLLLPLNPPSIRVFSNELTLLMRWPKYWSFSFSISPSNEHPGLISFRMDWLNLLAVQGTLKSLLQHHSSKALSSLHSPTLTSIHDHCIYVQMYSHWHFSSHYIYIFFCIVYNCRGRKWQPTPEFLPGESHGQRSLAGYSLWSHKSQTRVSN